MREDPTKQDDFKTLDLWNDQKHKDIIFVPNEQDPTGRMAQRFSFSSNSLSGNERNRMFLRHDDNFSDVTLVSGADDMADGRSFALLDFDQDGWQDIALMSLNAPRFKLYRNEMQRLFPDNKSLRFRLVGGHDNSSPTTGLSNRDGIGARVQVEFESGNKLMMQKQCGEGFASQNSEILSIGIPAGDTVIGLKIRWPSGKTTRVDSPDTSNVITIKEVQQ